MRKVIVLTAALLLLGQPVPGLARAAPRLPDYTVEDFSPELRALPATRALVDDSDRPTGEAGGSAGGSGPSVLQVGEQKRFLVLDDVLGRYRFRTFTLRAVGTEGEVWVDNDLDFPAGDPRGPVVVTDEQARYLLSEFDTNIYPKEQTFFGTPDTHTGEHALLSAWGIVPPDYYRSADGSSRVIILVTNIRDEHYYDPQYPHYIAGYFSPAIELYTDRNVITVDAFDWANRVGPNDAPWRPADPSRWRPHLYEGVFAHEFQHLIHDDLDPDEENFINEGLSDFAEFLTGYSDLNTDRHIESFMNRPYNSLVAWEDQGDLEILSDYGAAYLFTLYLNQLYGEPFIRALARNPENGIRGVNATLEQLRIPDDFTAIYRDWAVAVLLASDKPAGGRYHVEGVDRRVNLETGAAPTGAGALAWGPSYHVIDARPRIRELVVGGIRFLPTPWRSVPDPLGAGNAVLWSGGGNMADHFLVAPLDLSGVTSARLEFDTLYDIEEGWDFGFVQVSADGGETWTTLANASTTTAHDPNAHPDIVANLPGLTGYSGGWVHMQFDLTPYAGKPIQLAFRYMTDWAAEGNGNLEPLGAGPGWYIDNVRVDAVGFSADGSSTDPFTSLDEIRQRFTDYLISFVGLKRGGSPYKVLHLDLVRFTDADEEELRKFLHDASLVTVMMVVSHAAPPGQVRSVPFHFRVERQETATGGPPKPAR